MRFMVPDVLIIINVGCVLLGSLVLGQAGGNVSFIQ